MSPHPLIDLDASALAIARLSVDPDTVDALGGAGRVAAVNRPPYPRLLVTDVDSDDRDLRWLVGPVLQVEAVGDLDGIPGKAALRRILITALTCLAAWPDEPAPVGAAVVTSVTSATGSRWSPLGNGQPRYVASLRLYVHPARS